MHTYIHYIHTTHTYIRTYITLHYITLHYVHRITRHYNTCMQCLHASHTYMRTRIHITYITYMHYIQTCYITHIPCITMHTAVKMPPQRRAGMQEDPAVVIAQVPASSNQMVLHIAFDCCIQRSCSAKLYALRTGRHGGQREQRLSRPSHDLSGKTQMQIGCTYRAYRCTIPVCMYRPRADHDESAGIL